MKTKLTLGTAAACQSITNFPLPFLFQFNNATATAWNKTMSSKPELYSGLPNGATPFMLPGDTVSTVTPNCGTAGRRSLLQGGSVDTAADANLPPGFTAQMASAASSSFSSNAQSAYISGQFASNYGVTGATVSVGDPVTNTYNSPSSSSNNNLAIGLGVGLGVGIPVLLGAGYAFYAWNKKQGAQVVAPSEAA
jgi:hypothetical protein